MQWYTKHTCSAGVAAAKKLSEAIYGSLCESNVRGWFVGSLATIVVETLE